VGIGRMRHYLSEHRAAGSEAMVDYFLALIAIALARKGQFDEGLRTIDQSLPIIERTGARWNEAEVHLLKGELLLNQDARILLPTMVEREARR
jgi:predicted ATPase